MSFLVGKNVCKESQIFAAFCLKSLPHACIWKIKIPSCVFLASTIIWLQPSLEALHFSLLEHLGRQPCLSLLQTSLFLLDPPFLPAWIALLLLSLLPPSTLTLSRSWQLVLGWSLSWNHPTSWKVEQPHISNSLSIYGWILISLSIFHPRKRWWHWWWWWWLLL